ncbi:MAG: thymidine phosphorylase [Clostridiales bacterium]|nr:thymidine phosphorylase [Clostridiales bacterium]
MSSYDIISKTKNGIELTDEEIRWFVNGYVNGEIPDYQLSAWLMAVCFNSLSDRETTALTLAMCESGEMINLSGIDGITVDKHSTGGVGDKTSLIIAPIISACGAYVPKMSGRGLGHTGGTIDKLESIPNFKTELSFERFIEVVGRAGFSIISQSGNIVPADKKIYALRDATATVDSIPLISSSIMSKKLAMGADCILLDVKLGSGAFMKTEETAIKLANTMVNTAVNAGKGCRAMITNMDEPLGDSVGNAIEIMEVIEILKGNKKGRLYELCIDLSANMLEMAEKGNAEECKKLAIGAINSGQALERLRLMIELQGGNPSVIDNYSLLPQPKYSVEVLAEQDGYIAGINSEEVGLIALKLGAGRATKDSEIDLSAGIKLNESVGDYIEKGEKIMTLFSSMENDFDEALNMARKAVMICQKQKTRKPMVYNIIY